MSLIRYTHPMLSLQQQINRMFDQFDTDLVGRLEELGDGFFAPAVDVKEDDEAYTVLLEVPGVKQENLNLALQDNVLSIKGTKEREEQKEGRYRRVERSYGSFVRSLSLPRNIDEGSVTADLRDGVLEVRLPKREEARPRQIEVSVSPAGGRLLEGGSFNGATSRDGSLASENEPAENGISESETSKDGTSVEANSTNDKTAVETNTS
jgi:HSP20 family protein